MTDTSKVLRFLVEAAARAEDGEELEPTAESETITYTRHRLSEAARLGFRYAVVPKGVLGAGPVPPEVQVVEVGTVLEAVQALAAP